MEQLKAKLGSKIRIFFNLAIFHVSYKIAKSPNVDYLLFHSSLVMGNFFTMEYFKTQLCSKIRFSQNLAIFSLKIENTRISNFFCSKMPTYNQTSRIPGGLRCISDQGVGRLHFEQGTVNAQVYIGILGDNCLKRAMC